MNEETARSYVERRIPKNLGDGVNVGVALRTGSHHTIVLFSRENGGEYVKGYNGKHPSAMRDLEIAARVGDVIYQRATSPASAQVLERYGMVLGSWHIDWGTDSDWVVDFGPMGDVTRRGLRSPTSSPRIKRDRVFSPDGEEATGGATENAGGTSHGSG